MVKVFIDTSIFIRFFTSDVAEKYEECRDLFSLVEEGKLTPYTSNIVVLEIVFVLTRQYKFSKQKVKQILSKLFKLRNLTVLDRTNTQKAIELFNKYNIKFADCMIATQIGRGVKLATYDTDFSKMKFISSVTPIDVIRYVSVTNQK